MAFRNTRKEGYPEVTKFYNCSCFYKRNIFIPKYEQHFVFENEEQFRQDYKPLLNSFKSEEEEKSLFEEIQSEIERRKASEEESLERKEIIEETYTHLHPNIISFENNFLHRNFQRIVEIAIKTGDKATLLNNLDILSVDKKIYGFQLFTQKFCKATLEELDNFEKSPMPKGRPNSMNHYGVLLDELGFEFFIDVFKMFHLSRVLKLLYPELYGDELDSHRAFIVRYKMGQDVELHEHFDNAEITLNVCLGKTFSGGELFLSGTKDDQSNSTYLKIPQVPGYAILHRGKQLHGALPITEGERSNMIIWFRSSVIRNKQCPMCNQKPDLIPAEGLGDGFTSPDDKDVDCWV